MPTYQFLNQDTGKIDELVMTISERDQFVIDNPSMVQQLNKLNLGDPIRMGVTKPPESFRDILRNIKDKHLGSNVNII